MVRVNLVPGGKGSGAGSVLFLRRPQVSPPVYVTDLGKLVTGRQPSSRQKMEAGNNSW